MIPARPRAARELLIGIDAGASGVKVGLFDPAGELVALAREPVALQTPRPGWAEIVAEDWWAGAVRGVQRVLAASGLTERVAGIGLSGACPSLVALDAAGRALRPAILFLDTRSEPQAERLRALAPFEQAFALTGNRVSPGTTSAASIAWIRDEEPAVYAAAARFGHATTFLARRLTGVWGLDWTHASFTGLFETCRRRDWSAELCRAYGLDLDRLPPALPPWTRIGGLEPEPASLLGLPSGLPVALGGADSACSALAAGVVDEELAFETTGTSGVVAIAGREPRPDPRLLTRCHAAPDRWLLMGATSCAGASFDWFLRAVLDRAGEPAETLVARALDLAAAAPPGANGVLFLPYLSGERSPVWDPRARGVFFGLTLSTTTGDLARAVLEGNAHALRQNLTIAEARLGRPVPALVAAGGGAKSPLACQIKADVTGREVRALEFPETAVLGAALLGGVAAGLYHDPFAAAAAAAHRAARVHRPDPAARAVYDRQHALYAALYPALKELYAASGAAHASGAAAPSGRPADDRLDP